MLDLKFLRENPKQAEAALGCRGVLFSCGDLLAADARRREMLNAADDIREQQNLIRKKIGAARKSGSSEAETLTAQNRELSERLEQIKSETDRLESSINGILTGLPNLPAAGVPMQDTVLYTEGTPRAFLWEPKSGEELAADLKLTAGPQIWCGMGSRLLRALQSLCLDVYSERGYTEITFPAQFVSGETDMEDPLLPLNADSVADETLRLCGCFLRSPAKERPRYTAELSCVTEAETAAAELERMTDAAAEVLRRLGLGFSAVRCGAANLAFSAADTLLLQIAPPGSGSAQTICRCSLYGDFLAGDQKIRIRPASGGKPRTAGTLHGATDLSALAMILAEHNQNGDGSVSLPAALQSYMGCGVLKPGRKK